MITQPGCVSPDTTEELAVTPEFVESQATYRKEYILTPGDQLDVVVVGNAQVSRSCLIRPDGFISLPLLDDVKAGGLTVSELDASLTESFSKRLVEPEVTVIATLVREPMVYVFGEVASPAAISYRNVRTVAQAIALAGGFKYSAEQRSVAVIRLTEEGRLRAYQITTDMEGQPAPFMAMHAMMLQPDDLIVVPESGRSQTNRWINDYINQPLSGFNSLLGTFTAIRLIQVTF